MEGFVVEQLMVIYEVFLRRIGPQRHDFEILEVEFTLANFGSSTDKPMTSHLKIAITFKRNIVRHHLRTHFEGEK